MPVGVASVTSRSRSSVQANSNHVLMGAERQQSEEQPPEKVKIRLADREATEKAGVEGVLLSVSRSDGMDAPGRAQVELNYSSFRHAFGADWGSRLRLVQLPECALTSPDRAECRATAPLRTRNDAKNGTLTAEVPLAVPTAGGPERKEASKNGRRAVPNRGKEAEARVSSVPATVLAATATPEGSEGDFKATSLSPSGSWKAGGNAGGFSWSYPLQLPPVPGDMTPKLGLGYSSSAIDGRTAAVNNQASWIGDGWSLEPGFIERQYMSCKDDNGKGSNAPKETGDLCWRSDNAVMSLNGSNTALVKDGKSGVWKPEMDDGSRVEHLNGSASDTANGSDGNEYWKVTTSEGTQYWFGKNRLPGWSKSKPETDSTYTVPVYGNHEGEPGHQSAFKDSARDQAWRWNLDYVVDPHGNAMAYFYDKETNAYAKNSGGAHTAKPKADAVYDRGGTLNRIEYGHRVGKVYDAKPAAKVLFGTADRCLGKECAFDKKHSENWPDTPFDQVCEKGKECINVSPTFWSKKRLTTITTQALKSGSYHDVDTWSLTHQFPGVGDAGGSALWLSTITHTGKAGNAALSMPKVDFGGTLMPNRVDSDEGRPPLNKYRITRISGETGSDTLIDYSAPECVAGKTPKPQSNNKRCYPTWWSPEGAVDPIEDWFHKYVVTKVTENDKVGGAEPKVTSYEYLDGIAWAKDTDEFVPEKRRAYSDFRGYGKVRARTGSTDKGLSESTFLRGIDGAKVTDSSGAAFVDAKPYAGQLLENTVYDKDGGKISSATINRPWSRQTADQPRSGTTDLIAHQVRTQDEIMRTLLSDGSWRTTKTSNAFDEYGRTVSSSDEGDTSVKGDETCTRTTYSTDKADWLMSYPSTVQRTSTTCDTAADQKNVLDEIRTSYDGKPHGQAPESGKANPTKVDELDRFDGDEPKFITTSVLAYDATGRTIEATDAAGHTTKTAYSPADGAQPTKTTTTDPKGFTKTAELDGLRGLTLRATDANGRTTSQRYDALGHLIAAWKPGRPTSAPADVLFSYDIRPDRPSAVTSKTLLENGKYRTAISLYDGLLRKRQTQTDAHGGKGRLITDTFYDSHGRSYKANAEYYNDGATAPTILSVADNKVPQQTVTEYDGQSRTTASVFKSLNTEKWRTTTAYGGNWTSVVPPQGGTATLTVDNAQGKPIEVRQYKNGKPSYTAPGDTYEALKYTYDSADRLSKLVDAGGNVWTATYDLRGRRITTSDPDKGIVKTTYTPDGKVATTTDARGRTVANTYDELGRRTSLREGGASGGKLAEWTYDTVTGGKGLLGSSTRYEKGNAYTTAVSGYDDAGRATGSDITIPLAEGNLAGSYSFNTTYTANTGLAATTSYPAGGGLAAETVKHGYTEFGLPTTVSGNGRVYSLGNEYSPAGDLLQTVLGDIGRRTVQTFTYETDTRRLGSVINDREANKPQTLDSKVYSYDPAGNINRVRDDRDDNQTADIQCYTYDFARRLADAWTVKDDCSAQPSGAERPQSGGVAPYWHSYTYDAVGNRTTETRHDPSGDASKDVKRTYTYPEKGSPVPHAPTEVGVTGPGARDDSFGYDDAGNTIRRITDHGDQKITWDVEGRMASSTTDGKTSTFLYNADGERLLRRDADAVTLYLGSEELRLDLKSGKVTGTRYYTAQKSTVVASSDGSVSYLLSDQNGTDELAVDAQTLRYTRRDHGPFGTARGPQPTDDAWPSEHGFVGGTRDVSTGLTHVGAREYDPDNGRFISVDPLMSLTNPQQMNAYAYANGNPVSNGDPSGQFSWDDFGGFISDLVDNINSGLEKLGALVTGGSSYRSGTRSSGGTSYASAKRALWDRGPAGAQYKRFNVGKGEDRGIIMVRFFIHTKKAMLNQLLGDDRSWSTDPDAAYRMVLFWDTASGDVAFKVSASHTPPTTKTIAPYATGAGPIKVDSPSVTIPANDLKVDAWPGDTLGRNNVINKDYLGHKSTSDKLDVGVHGVQSLFPLFAVDNDVTIAPNRSSVTVSRSGDAYPDMEAVQYRRNQEPKVLARDSMAHENGLDSSPIKLFGYTSINRTWTDGTCTGGC
ncbi:RHS repeat-associated core domain-containing protein [Streptomyces varsoviensis]|uniref:RHS repeat domain-containing protein n=1 Tax=Streptomyces varsoviensis TaxID=67373 RepID=UPI0033DF8E8C